MKQTHTYVILEVSRHTFEEISEKLKEAHYDHAFAQDGKVIDMQGIAIESNNIACSCGVRVHELENLPAPVQTLDHLTRKENWAAGYFEGVRSALRKIAERR